MDSVHIGTQPCSLQSSLKLCKLYFCPSVFSMRLFVGSFAHTSHRCTLLYVPSLPLWTYTIRRNNLKCFETSYYSKINAIWWFKSVVLKPVLGTPNHSKFCMSPSFNTPDLTHQLISRVCKTWSGCGLWERHTKCVVAGGPQDRFENHWFKWCLDFTLMSRSSAHAPQMKPLLHNTASGENTVRLSLSLILDAFYTVKAVLVSWTRGERYHSNRKAWQNDYSLKSAHPKKICCVC